jgi:two-component system C4-dicarboxylate transport sensor histidine kinase DctB
VVAVSLRLADVVRRFWPSAAGAYCRLTAAGAARGPEPLPGPPAGSRWSLHDIRGDGAAHGVLGLALPEEVGPEAPVHRLLGAYARELALRLDADAGRRERAKLEAALAEEAMTANLGALASPITHEFNNFLNVILLQVAVLEQELPEKRRNEFAVIRQQGKGVAELVRQWQQYRHRQQPALQAVDLNQTVRRVAEALGREPAAFGESPIRLAPEGAEPAEPGVWVRLALDPKLPAAAAAPVDLQRLVRFLLTNAAAAITSARGRVTVRTASADGRVLLRVEDNGPSVDPARLPEFFEPHVSAREGPNRLELATCKALAHRRLQGNLHAENRPEGGVAVVLTLKLWAEAH